ncbi:MAG: MOSC domain-containing protein [Burkholderiales bacterium]|nr:MOSC domain-containing protein [Burkholderiales bacterium]
MRLSELYVHPLKSCRGNALNEARVEVMGLQHDRRWMVADGDRFFTGREFPRMVLIETTPDADGITFNAPGMAPLRVERREMRESVPTTVWRSSFNALAGSDEADFWFSDYLGANCRLLHIGEDTERRTNMGPATPVGFADGYPVLLIGTASLAALNSRLDTPVTMRNFRTNLVVETSEPFIEDSWRHVRVGDIELEFVKTCARCIFTTVDPTTAMLHAAEQPLATLNQFRRTDEGTMFGVNLITRNTGVLRIGDAVTVLD